MFSFLRALGLQPLEWEQAVGMTGEATPEISQILARAFSVAQAIVVVLSGDDLARLREEFLTEEDSEYERYYTPQARPNVLFEAGMALGAYPQRTVLVQVGTIRPFSDIAGRHIVRLDNSPARRQQLAQRLTIAGCEVDTSGVDWHVVGDFQVTSRGSSERDGASQSGSKASKGKLSVIAALAYLEEEALSESDGPIWITAEEVAGHAKMRTMVVQDILHELRQEGSIEEIMSYDGRTNSTCVMYKLTQKGRAALVVARSTHNPAD